jgi:hypothetical protein
MANIRRKAMTIQEAKQLTVGQCIFHKIQVNRTDGMPERWKVNGKVKTWVRSPDKVKVPIKHGLYDYAYLDNFNLEDFSVIRYTLMNYVWANYELDCNKKMAKFDPCEMKFDSRSKVYVLKTTKIQVDDPPIFLRKLAGYLKEYDITLMGYLRDHGSKYPILKFAGKMIDLAELLDEYPLTIKEAQQALTTALIFNK